MPVRTGSEGTVLKGLMDNHYLIHRKNLKISGGFTKDIL